MPKKKEDHRIRVAKVRRDNMRRKLLRAVMVSYAHGRQQIDDVIEEAEVSRATFYKYFTSFDEAFNAVVEELADELRNDILEFIKQTENPLGRIAAGIQIFLLRSVTDPVWGDFVSQTNFLVREKAHRAMIGADLIVARKQGLVQFDDIEAATSLLIGTMMEGAQYLWHSGVRKRSYVEELNVLILRAFGVPHSRAQEIVRDRVIFVRGLAPDRLTWWRDPWL